MATSKLKLSPSDYQAIDNAVQPQGTEVYSVVTHRHRGQFKRSVHVFTRMPNEQELHKFESTASSMEFKGKKAKVMTGQVPAAVLLYGHLIDRVYDIPVGARVVEKLDRKGAVDQVDVMTKRKAVIDLVGQVWASSEFDDDEDDEETDPKKGE